VLTDVVEAGVAANHVRRLVLGLVHGLRMFTGGQVVEAILPRSSLKAPFPKIDRFLES
jgi:hypothetical protein